MAVIARVGLGGNDRLRRAARSSLLSRREVDRQGRDQVRLAAVCFTVTWAGCALLAVLRGEEVGGAVRPSVSLLSLTTAVLAGGASVMCLIRWRLTGERAAVFAGLGLLVFGVVRVGLADLVLPLTRSGTASGLGLFGDAAWMLTFALLLVAVIPPADRGGASGRRWVPVAVLAGLVAVLALFPEAAGGQAEPAAMGWSAHWLAGNLLVAGAWAALGIVATVTGLRTANPLRVWVGMTLLAFAQSRMASALLPSGQLWLVAAEVFRTTGIALMFLGTARAFHQALIEQRGHLDEFRMAVEGSETQRRAEGKRQEEIVHNLLSALSSVGAAAQVLSGESATLTRADRDQVAQALESELARVRRLLGESWRPESRPFFLVDVLMPLVVCARADGADIIVDVPAALEVLGSPSATAEVVQTLVENARRHAPGSSIEITARAAAGWVAILVEDRGPGLPEGCDHRVFERGWSTDETGEGRGLGLFVAERLVQQQGGTIRARCRPGGGASFSVEVPAPASAGTGALPTPTTDAGPASKVGMVGSSPTHRGPTSRPYEARSA